MEIKGYGFDVDFDSNSESGCDRDGYENGNGNEGEYEKERSRVRWIKGGKVDSIWRADRVVWGRNWIRRSNDGKNKLNCRAKEIR